MVDQAIEPATKDAVGRQDGPDASGVLTEYAPALARLAGRYALPDDREDLLQDILFALWRSLPTFRGDSSVRTFVYRVAHNRGIAYWRARRNTTVPLSDSHDAPDPRADTATDIERQLRHEQLAAAVDRLPAVQRDTVRLSLRGWSYDEIATAHGVTVSNVGVRLTRARQMLRRQLAAAK